MSPVENAVRDQLYVVRHFGRRLAFTLTPDGTGGTDLSLSCTDPTPDDDAHWTAFLLRLKAAVDHGVDLRNHDPCRTTGYVDT